MRMVDQAHLDNQLILVDQRVHLLQFDVERLEVQRLLAHLVVQSIHEYLVVLMVQQYQKVLVVLVVLVIRLLL